MSSEETRKQSCTDATDQTCDDCGQPYSHVTTAGPGRTKRSCGCDEVLNEVADDTANAFANLAIRALNAAGDVETAAQVHEGARGRLVTDGGIQMSRDRFECSECGFASSDRDEFGSFGLAMSCPECQSLRVEHVFTADDDDAGLLTDGGVDDADKDDESIFTDLTVEAEPENPVEDAFYWGAVCPQQECSHLNVLRGNPLEFANRPYACSGCGWVSLMDSEAVRTFVDGNDEVPFVVGDDQELVTDGGGQTLPVQLAWRRTDDGSEDPFVNVDGEEFEALLDEYDVDSLEELVEKRDLRRFDSHRLGKITRYDTGDGYEYEMTTEVELLQRAEGINEELARGLLSEYDDIPSICRWRREHGDVFLGETLHDAKHEERAWADALEEFISSTSKLDDGIEKRLKEACEWVEPDNVVADGGIHTVTRNGQEFAVVRQPEFVDDAELDIGPAGEIRNYDEVEEQTTIRLLSVGAIRAQDIQNRVIGPDDPDWEDEYADLELGESIVPDHEDPVADGGVSWYDLTGFKRDILRVLADLHTDGEENYGLAIKRRLEDRYQEEILHGRLYPNLNDLVAAGLIDKSELDKRTNQYELTPSARSILREQREAWDDLEVQNVAAAQRGGAQ